MKYEITVNSGQTTWTNHRTEEGALKSYREACENGQSGIQIFRSGTEVFPFDTYDREIGHKGVIICDQAHS